MSKLLREFIRIALTENRVKYPRTYHLPWSESATDDDKTHKIEAIVEMFEGKDVVVTEKLDGENTTIYSDGGCHARSTSSAHHPSRSVVKQKAAQIGCDIPKGWRLMGENLYAKHSITYDKLPDYFVLFGIADEKNMSLSWDDVEEWGQLLDIPTAPVVWRGVWDEEIVRKLYPFESKYGSTSEGYVVRVASSFPMSAFSQNVAKFVRGGHVQTDKHWAHQTVVPNIKA